MSVRHSEQPKLDLSRLSLARYLDQLPHQTVVCLPDGEIVHVNRAWMEFSQRNGYAGPSFIGLNYFEICLQADGAEGMDGRALVEGLRGVVAGAADTFEHTYPCHSRSERRWFRVLAMRADGAPGPVPLVVHHIDISREVEQASEHACAKREAGLFHDLNDALAPITLNVELARDSLEGRMPAADHAKALQRAVDACERAENMLRSMFQRARLLSETDATVERVFDFEALARQYIALFEGQAANINIVCHAGHALLLGSPAVLDRILSNLIGNAVKYSRAESAITVAIARNRSGGLMLSVADQGMGIPQDLLPKIFQPYTRDQRISRNIPGAGMGLTTVKEMVEAMGGEISVRSELNVGTEFTIAFPSWRSSHVL